MSCSPKYLERKLNIAIDATRSKCGLITWCNILSSLKILAFNLNSKEITNLHYDFGVLVEM